MPEGFSSSIEIFFSLLAVNMVNYIDRFQNETTLLLRPRRNLLGHDVSSIFFQYCYNIFANILLKIAVFI